MEKKKPKETQQQGCPTERRCNISVHMKGAVGIETNNQLLAATTGAGGKKARAWQVLLLLLLYIAAMLYPVALPLLDPDGFPKMSSKLNSFSVILQSNASICDLLLSAKINIAFSNTLSVDIARASVRYREERIWEKVMEPFNLTEKEEVLIRVNMTAGAAVWQRVAAGDFAAEKSRNGSLELNLNLEGIGRKDGDERNKVMIEIICRKLKVRFDYNSEVAQLLDIPKKCKTQWQ